MLTSNISVSINQIKKIGDSCFVAREFVTFDPVDPSKEVGRSVTGYVVTLQGKTPSNLMDPLQRQAANETFYSDELETRFTANEAAKVRQFMDWPTPE